MSTSTSENASVVRTLFDLFMHPLLRNPLYCSNEYDQRFVNSLDFYLLGYARYRLSVKNTYLPNDLVLK